MEENFGKHEAYPPSAPEDVYSPSAPTVELEKDEDDLPPSYDEAIEGMTIMSIVTYDFYLTS